LVEDYKPIKGPAAAIFNPKRFSIMSVLYLRGALPMKTLRDATGLTWGDLDSNLRYLERRGLVALRRVLTSKGPRTYVVLTDEGARAYEELVSYLRSTLARRPPETREAEA